MNRTASSPATPPRSAAEPRARHANFIDPAALMRIRSLQMRAKAVVDGFLGGLHRSPFHGFSVEFTEYRHYSPGDDLRFLDWRLFARSDHYYLRKFEDETNARCYLLVDLSRSMGFRSLSYDKADYARTVAATVAYFLTLQRDSIGLITFDEAIQDYVPARFRPGHMHRLMLRLERSPAGKGTDLARPLDQIARTASKRGLVILLSDLLAPVEDVEVRLGYLRARGHDVIVIRILDPAEIGFEFKEEALFYDLETGRELYVDPRLIQKQYHERFTEHARAMARACHKIGADYFELTTDRPLDAALFDLLQSRARRGRSTARRGGAGRAVGKGAGG